jgi:hypothetical protein
MGVASGKPFFAGKAGGIMAEAPADSQPHPSFR